MKHLIIGAGITGLYLAYKLLSQDIKASDIIIFEKSDRIGGRIYTHENRGYKYSAGAGRLGKKHKYVMKLIKDFNLQEQIININKNNNYFVDGKLMNEQQLLKHYKSQYKSLDDLWKYAIEKKINTNKYNLNNYNLHNYFSLILPTNEVELLKVSLGYVAEMYDMNAYNGLLTLRKDFDVKNKEFYVLRDGIQILCDVLYEHIKREGGVNIKLSSTLEDVFDDKKYIIVNGTTYNYSKLYLTIKRKDYMDIAFFKKYDYLFNSVVDGTLNIKTYGLRICQKYLRKIKYNLLYL
jgi:protoporphyrinogen oxidase